VIDTTAATVKQNMEDAVRVAVLPDVTPPAVTETVTWERETAVKHLPDMELMRSNGVYIWPLGGGRSPIRDHCSTSRWVGADLSGALKRARSGSILQACREELW
jgi:hypothetical protein